MTIMISCLPGSKLHDPTISNWKNNCLYIVGVSSFGELAPLDFHMTLGIWSFNLKLEQMSVNPSS